MRVGPLLVLAGGGRTFCEVSSSADVDDVLCCCELDLGSSALKISKRSHHLLSSIARRRSASQSKQRKEIGSPY